MVFTDMAFISLVEKMCRNDFAVSDSLTTGWTCHQTAQVMDPGSELVPAISGIVELDEKYIGGKPRYQRGEVHKRGKGTAKQ